MSPETDTDGVAVPVMRGRIRRQERIRVAARRFIAGPPPLIWRGGPCNRIARQVNQAAEFPIFIDAIRSNL